MKLTKRFKEEVVKAFREAAAEELERATNAHKDSVDAATHEECRCEHTKDMRSTEASYLARGMAKRVVDKEASVELLKHPKFDHCFGDDARLEAGALLLLEDEDEADRLVLLLDPGVALRTTVQGRFVQGVSMASPMGEALSEAALDDEVTVVTPRGRRTYLVLECL